MTTNQELGLIPRGRKTFNQVAYSALDRKTIEEALDGHIRANFPAQQDFVASDGYSIVRRLIAYVTDGLSYRADYLANNCYLPTVTNLRALDNLLTLIGYRRTAVNPAVTDVAIIPKTSVGEAPQFDNNGNMTSAGINRTIRIPARTAISGVGKDGNPVQFELFASANNIYDDIIIAPGEANTIAYAIEGESKTYQTKSNGSRFLQVVLPDIDISMTSIRVNVGVFNLNDPLRGTLYRPNNEVLPEWENVDFLVTRGEGMFYEVRLRNDGLTVITFGDGVFGNLVPKGHDIIVNYRVGGGERGNVLPEALEGGGNFPVYQSDLRTTDSMACQMVNVTRGIGGRNEETIEEAKLLAPLVYQAQNRAVKDIDFAAFALKHPSVSKAIAVARQPIVIDAVEDRTVYDFPLAETVPYTMLFDLHRFDTRETRTYSASISLPKTSYDNVDELIIDLNLQLGWYYDEETLSFREIQQGQGFLARFDKAIEGYIELWIETGNYQARVTLRSSGNSLFPLLHMPLGGYGRLEANYIDLHVLGFADDGNVSVPNAAMVNALRTYFDDYREINASVNVKRGFIRRVDVNGHVYIDRSADPITTQQSVDNAIRDLFRSDNRELGEPLYVSKIYEAIEAVEGVAYVDQFFPSQNVFPDDKTLLQLGTVNIEFYESRQ